jgi:hypothetical protein
MAIIYHFLANSFDICLNGQLGLNISTFTINDIIVKCCGSVVECLPCPRCWVWSLALQKKFLMAFISTNIQGIYKISQKPLNTARKHGRAREGWLAFTGVLP